MKNEITVIEAKLDSFGGKTMYGFWCVDLLCGHKVMSRTRKDCVIFPHKKIFCGQCWAKEDSL